MKEIVLSVKPTDYATGSTTGWFIPGNDPQKWADEIAQAGLEICSTNLHVIAVPGDATRIEGVFIPTTETDISEQAIPYQRLGEKLYLPVHAEITPPILPEELDELLSEEISTYIWHPGIGMVAFEADNILALSALISRPGIQSESWGRAQVGTYMNQRLKSIGRIIPSDADDLMDTMGEDIGSRSQDIQQLDQSPMKSVGQFFSQIGQGIRSWFKPKEGEDDVPNGTASPSGQKVPGNNPGAGFKTAAGMMAGIAFYPLAWVASKIAGGVPGTASGPTWINHVENWANQFMQNSLNLLNARNREIQKLLNMLEMSPDEGLKYAIPMSGSDSGQQASSASASLGLRDVNFSLSGLSNNGPADYWDLPPEVQLELLERYRQLAQREKDLGRFRRAAYIYAELLGDLHLAAAALIQGEHYQEAAVVYEKKLNNKSEAARCYTKAGDFEQAFRLYEVLKAFEQIGDLCLKLDREEEAVLWFRRAAEAERLQQNYMRAAKLLEEKVHVPKEAIEFLREARPGGNIDKQLVCEAFRLMGKYGFHHDAKSYAGEFRQFTGYAGSDAKVSEALLTVLERYPDDLVKQEALYSIQTLTSRSLKEHTSSVHGCLKVLTKTAPEDRLLPRDTLRYERNLSRKQFKKQQRERRNRENHPVLGETIAEIDLKIGQCPGIEYRSTPWGWFALLKTESQFKLYFADWNAEPGNFGQVDWPIQDKASMLFCPLVVDKPSVAILPVGGQPLAQNFTAISSGTAELAGTPGWISEHAVAIAVSPIGSQHWILESNGTLSVFQSDGTLIKSVTVLRELVERQIIEESVTIPFPMVVSYQYLYFAIGRTLVMYHHSGTVGTVRTAEFDQPIRRIVMTTPGTRTRLALLFDEGGAVYWTHDDTTYLLPDDLIQPSGLFLRDGRLLIASDHFIQSYTTSKGHLERIGKASISGQISLPPNTLLSTNENDVVAIADGEGRIIRFRVQPLSSN